MAGHEAAEIIEDTGEALAACERSVQCRHRPGVARVFVVDPSAQHLGEQNRKALRADRAATAGRGRLVADAAVEEFVRQSSRNDVLVRSPAVGALAGLLSQRGGAVSAETDGGLAVTGLDAAVIGDLARAHGITLHELTPRPASLEEAFMEFTQDSVDYRAGLAADTQKAA